jgi:phage-related protein
VAAPHLVGRVGIKVMPDTDDFKDKLKREVKLAVEQVEKSLKAITIRLDVTATSMAAVKRKIEQVARSLDPAVVDVQVNDADLLRVESELQALQDLVNDAVLGLDLDGADKSKVEAELAAIAESAREILLELNIPDAEKAAAKQALDDWENDNEPRDIMILPDLPTGAGRYVSARLSWMTREREAKITPRLNQPAYRSVQVALTALAALSGARAAWHWLDKIGDALKDIDKKLPVIAALALGVAGLTAWLAAATANLAALSADLARIIPTLLTMPGILAGFALGVGATVAVLKDFNEVLPEVSGMFSDLQASMSNIFWERAAEPIRTFIHTLFPQFQAGMEAVSSSLGGFFASFARDLQSSLDGSLPGMFDDLVASIDIAATATSAYAEIIRILGELGAGYLPRMAQWWVDQTERFHDFLAAAEADGRLQGWVERGLESLHHLGQVIKGLYRIFAGLALAAEEAGSTSLASLGERLNSIADTVNSPEFQQPLITFLEASHRMMGNIAATSGEAFKGLLVVLGETASAVFPLIGQTIGRLIGGVSELLAHPAVQGGLETFFIGVANGVFWLMQAVEPLQPGLAALLGLLGTGATELGRILGPVLGTVGEVVAVLAPALSEVVAVLAEGFLSAWQAIAPLIVLVAGYFADLLSALPLEQLTALAVDILTPLIALFMALVDAIAPLVVEFLPPLMAIALSLVEAFLPLLEVLTQIAQAVLVPLVEALLPGWFEYMTLLFEVIGPIVEQLLPGLVTVLELLMPLFEWLGELLGSTVALGFQILGEVVQAFWGILSGLLDLVIGVFSGDWERAWNGIKQIFTSIWDLIKGIALAVWDWLVSVFGDGAAKVWDWMKQLWEWVKGEFEKGKQRLELVGRLIRDKVSEKFGELKDRAIAKIQALPGLLRDKINDAKAKMLAVARAVKFALPEELRKMVDKAVEKVKELPGKAKEKLGDLKTKLVRAGKDLIQGFIDGIGDMFDNVKSTLGDLTGSLTSWKGPPQRDRVLLVEVGRLVMRGFLLGLESQYASIRASLGAFSNELGDMQFASPSAEVSVRAAAQIDAASRTGVEDNAAAARVLNYYAAPGQSLSEEEALFTATNRALRLGW